MSRKYLTPWVYFSFTFLFLIITGTILLYLQSGLSFIDSLFTSTSAVCVTGLIVVDTAKLNTISQIIILILIQLGGLGIMTLTSGITVLFRGALDLEKKVLLKKVTDYFSFYELEKILKIVLAYTFLCELIGAIILSISFKIQGYPLIKAIYYGIFHSISAFCNAGFSTFSNSLVGTNFLTKISISLLIILGGIGFFVVYDIYYSKRKVLSIHSKIVILTTLLLIIVGTILIYFFNFPNISFLDSFFQAVTPRTAGFNTVNLNALSIDSLIIILMLMVIGASPGSTGGGIKTTTFFIIFISCFKVIKGEENLVVFKRKISNFTILKSFSLFFIYITIILISTFFLLNTNQHDFFKCLFETTSALGTVGLSLGITPTLTTFGKIIIIFCMFIGRIGPASFIMMLMLKEKKSVVDYPEEKIIIG